MPSRWTIKEEIQKRKELKDLYINQNKTIFEISDVLGITHQSVFKRIQRLGIRSCPEKKANYLGKGQRNVLIPDGYSEELSELVGVLLGDGHVGNYQIIITINKDETDYLNYLVKLLHNLFGVLPHIHHPSQNSVRRQVVDIYLGSMNLAKYFKTMGIMSHKVKYQVDIPLWVKGNEEYFTSFLRGFFDTDGSIYKLRYGVQVCYRNASMPLLNSTRELLRKLDFTPSNISNRSLYLTKRLDLVRFFSEIQPRNDKHIKRAQLFGII